MQKNMSPKRKKILANRLVKSTFSVSSRQKLLLTSRTVSLLHFRAFNSDDGAPKYCLLCDPRCWQLPRNFTLPEREANLLISYTKQTTAIIDDGLGHAGKRSYYVGHDLWMGCRKSFN